MGEGASLLRLPPEVHRLILDELPLSSHLLYRTQVCSYLRTLFDGHLILCQSHRFDLVEWTRAQREIRILLARQDRTQKRASEKRHSWTQSDRSKSIWDTSPTATPRPAPAASAPPSIRLSDPARFGVHHRKAQSTQVMEDILVRGDHHDVDLFVRCMQMLGKMGSSLGAAKVEGPLPDLKSDKVTVLSLLSRSGFKVASLIQLLETQPSLYHIETIFMTTASSNDGCECSRSSRRGSQTF